MLVTSAVYHQIFPHWNSSAWAVFLCAYMWRGLSKRINWFHSESVVKTRIFHRRIKTTLRVRRKIFISQSLFLRLALPIFHLALAGSCWWLCYIEGERFWIYPSTSASLFPFWTLDFFPDMIPSDRNELLFFTSPPQKYVYPPSSLDQVAQYTSAQSGLWSLPLCKGSGTPRKTAIFYLFFGRGNLW